MFANLPLYVMAISEGKEVAIVRAGSFHPFWDDGEPPALFDQRGFFIGGLEDGRSYEYDKTYKLDECPALEQWLRRQHFSLVNMSEVVKV
jgi:hypothetical protein